jgi:hypothetical protein
MIYKYANDSYKPIGMKLDNSRDIEYFNSSGDEKTLGDLNSTRKLKFK